METVVDKNQTPTFVCRGCGETAPWWANCNNNKCPDCDLGYIERKEPMPQDTQSIESLLYENQLLKEEVEQLNQLIDSIKTTVIKTIGGSDYEGRPVGAFNYLQRLRILVEKEAELDRMIIQQRKERK